MGQPRLVHLGLIAGFALLAGCGSGGETGPDAADAKSEIYGGEQKAGVRYGPTDKSAGNAASLRGVVRLAGTPPRRRRIDDPSDAVCRSAHPNGLYEEKWVAGEGNALRWVFVWIKQGMEKEKFPVPQAQKSLDQHGCVYSPHVLGLQTGQRLNVLNSDPTLHNVHVSPQKNSGMNQPQTAGAKPIEVSYNRAEVGVHFICDVHSWMSAYVHVVPHPFFAVTDEKGAFEIGGVPPGKYLLGVWHEVLGVTEMEVTLGPKEEKTLEVTLQTK